MTHRRISGLAGLAGQAASGAVSAARHPVATTGYVVGLAKGVTTATIDAVRRSRSGVLPGQRAASDLPSDLPGEPTVEPAPDPDRPTPGERTLYGGLNTEAAPPRSPGGGGVEVEHEPAPESRAVAHGDAATSAREAESWAEEAADEVDVETPVGTTGADVGFNPDTAEADLQQPDTEPLVDPSTAKAVRSEAETLQKGADPDKG